MSVLLSVTTVGEQSGLTPSDIIPVLTLILGGGGVWGMIKWRQERKLSQEQLRPGLISANTDQWERLYSSVNKRVEQLEEEVSEVRALVDYMRELKSHDEQHQYELERHIYKRGEPPPPPKAPFPTFDTWRRSR